MGMIGRDGEKRRGGYGAGGRESKAGRETSKKGQDLLTSILKK